ncbi:MAG: Txe/YoeB family addiction module toxin [Bacilli bacterium]|nr:Txe/YoeB family addiction module toxin [Bacilli bacterium]
MNYLFTPNAWEDYIFWQENDKRIKDILKDISRNGASDGIGKPEPLTGDLKGFYSRRINDKDRLIYKVENNTISIISCRYHYSDK